jgi:hypothetical protein
MSDTTERKGTSDSKEDDGARKLIDKLTKTEGNDVCADCGEKSKRVLPTFEPASINLPCIFFADPQWASVKFGVFICISCAGIHRSLTGLSASKVRSIRLDSWTPDMVKVTLPTL